jgi:hypothetical protein
MRLSRALLVFGTVWVAAALPPRRAGAQSPPPPPSRGGTASAATVRWPVRTLPHVDLWLHSFALLSNDSARAPTVPLYARGYRDSLLVARHRRNVLTSLDGNQAALVAGLAQAGGYLEAQFLPFEFTSWEAMRSAADLFVQIQGDPRRAPSRAAQSQLAPFAGVFPTAADREWLRLFLTSVSDEQTRFFEADYQATYRARQAVITAVDSLWQQVYRAKFERFLNNSGQRQGDILLTLPIGGEGRSGNARGMRTMVAVPFPSRPADAPDVLYVLAHELTGTLVGPVVTDHVTPAEQRAGIGSRYVSIGQVAAGAMLLQRIAPELRDGYERYYLMQTGVTIPPGATSATLFNQTFVLPPIIRDALGRQLDLVLGGI